jgi:hypothetical protein
MDLKNRFGNDSSSDIDYSVKTIWNTTGTVASNKFWSSRSFSDAIKNSPL